MFKINFDALKDKEQKPILDNFDSATKDQTHTITEILNSIINKEKGIFSITGSAGVGKSWTITQIIKKILDLNKNGKIYRSIALCTPTHKSLNVLRKMLKNNNILESRIQTATIYSFLKLKLQYDIEDIDEDKEIVKQKIVKPDQDNINNDFIFDSSNVDILMIDESSMVSDELMDIILNKYENDSIKYLIFIGDPYQLKPVDLSKKENIAFTSDKIEKKLELKEIVRQAKDSSIITLANDLKEIISSKQFPKDISFLLAKMVQSDDIEIINDPQAFVDTYFKLENSSKMIGSYTNRIVDQYNNYIRYYEINKKLYDDPNNYTNNLPFITVDEDLVLQAPYTDSRGNIIFQNGEVVTIKHIDIQHDRSLIGNNLKYFNCRTEFENIKILHPESVDEYRDILSNLLYTAKNAKPFDKSEKWKKYFKLLNKYANVKYNYASTIHKLQGSTYEHMFFDARNLQNYYSVDPDNLTRLLYVALTRASKKLYILK